MNQDKKQKRADKKLAKAQASNNPKYMERMQKKFGYNYEMAISVGLTPDESGKWESVNPETGQILKGRKHPTIDKTKEAEKSLGNKVVKKKGVLYSVSKKNKK